VRIERPCGCRRAAEKRDELAPPHVRLKARDTAVRLAT
jgi:hypothetical protein